MIRAWAFLILFAVGGLALPALPVGDVDAKMKCAACESAIQLIAPLLRSNKSIAAVEKVAVPVCEMIKGAGWCSGYLPCKDLCVGIIHEFGPLYIKVFIENGEVGAETVCTLIKACDAPPAPPTPGPAPGPGLIIRSNLTDFTGERAWTQWQRPNAGLGTFVHITDTHLDLQYLEGTNPDCHEPLCCRAVNGPPPNGTRAAGKYGDYQCDVPPVLADNLWNLMKKDFSKNVDFVVLTGDEPPHDIWMQSQAGNTQAIDAVTAGLMQAFADVPTFPVLGNHAAYPVNQYQGPGLDSWLFDDVTGDWTHWLPADALRTLKFGGFYAARIRPGLRVIALHTTVLTADDVWLKLNRTAYDFSGQLAWLEDTLTQVRALNEKTYIIGHAPPTDFVEPLKSAFYELAHKNRDIIVEYLFGHAHTAPVQLLRRSDAEEPFAVVYCAGSVTTYQGLNPGFRIDTYDRASSAITSYDMFWMDLERANAEANEREPDWPLQYTAPAYFNMTDLSPTQWVAMAKTLVNDTGLYRAWHNAYTKGGPSAPSSPQEYACDILQLSDCKF